MKTFEIFRSGTHTTSKGQTLSFSQGDLDAIASGYNAETHQAPIVIGHPKQDAPAYGWVKSVSVRGDRLVVEPDQLNAEFADLVKDGAFKKVSAAFYAPKSAGNPTPGQYHLRHVGFLGAQPPAVKGLKPVEFDEGDAIIIEFAEGDLAFRNAWAFENLAGLFRRLRDYFIETTDLDTADKLLPDWQIGSLEQGAADLRAEGRNKEVAPAFSEPQTEPKDDDMSGADEARQAALDVREAELKEREAKQAARETEFSEAEQKRQSDEDAAFVADIVKAGRLPIGLQATATALFAELGDEEITFSEGDAEVKSSPRTAFKEILEKLPVAMSTGEIATGDGPDFSDPDYVTTAIEAEIKRAADAGEKISGATAAMRLQKR
ncbi:peptidase [uncultured Cohaesibacter sp.]|uniref:peptidase n=1 Tax=uncultured Cohaesibacter sp. TaxID=1002546 RepID=UPI0029C6AFE1|nr:peptidase [uncultured Cohaesibacter sp.]